MATVLGVLAVTGAGPGAGASLGRCEGIEAAIILQINLVRTEPQTYSRDLEHYERTFDGLITSADDEGEAIETAEGVAAVREAMETLLKRRPVGPVAPDPRLARAAAMLADEQAISGGVGHGGRQWSPQVRIAEAAPSWGEWAEVIGYGMSTAQGVVRQLIVDDGVPDRGHRTDLLDPALVSAGAACRPHPSYGCMCVVDLGGAPVSAARKSADNRAQRSFARID